MDLFGADLVQRATILFKELDALALPERVEALNALRRELHAYSPFAAEPVDLVEWVPAEAVEANAWNPNSVAPPEMRLLEHSITEDGFTQPIVAWARGEVREVVDGFHRNRVGKESSAVRRRVFGYLPVVTINAGREDTGDRMAATIRHNRARGKHRVEGMSDIVIELKRRNWTDERIGNELGMDPDEVLRLAQITGLAEMFADREFSEAWEHVRTPGEPAPAEDEDDGHVELDWMRPASPPLIGWDVRTDNNSVLWGPTGYRGMIQKSRFKDEWFWYGYTVPPRTGRAADREGAMRAVEEQT